MKLSLLRLGTNHWNGQERTQTAEDRDSHRWAASHGPNIGFYIAGVQDWNG